MQRYFIEVAYDGAGFSGFQIQENAPTIQSAIEEVFRIFFRKEISLTGSSRTDAGVHAIQNFFHFDWEGGWSDSWIYNLNALLPEGIAIRSVRAVRTDAHARFDAEARRYRYVVYTRKDPFLRDRGWHYPYRLDRSLLEELAGMVTEGSDFRSFSKRNTQVKTFDCLVMESHWEWKEGVLEYHVKANRFLRGMVRALVSTMLQVGRGNRSRADFVQLLEGTRAHAADFSAPAQGLYLEEVSYPADIFLEQGGSNRYVVED